MACVLGVDSKDWLISAYRKRATTDVERVGYCDGDGNKIKLYREADSVAMKTLYSKEGEAYKLYIQYVH